MIEPEANAFRREIAPNIHWFGRCQEGTLNGVPIHTQTSCYLIVGSERCVMVDTGSPAHWSAVERNLDGVLGGRELDVVVPTHPELPHSGNLGRIGRKYPRCRVLGDVRDYHLFYPELTPRLTSWPKGRPLELGEGQQVVLVDAVLRDLDNTVWVYEPRERVLFVVDGFGWVHHHVDVDAEEPVHRPGECGRLSSELPALAPWQATRTLRGALSWSRYRHADDLLAELREVLRRCPARLAAPTHGNVVVDPAAFVPIMSEAFTMSSSGALQGMTLEHGPSTGSRSDGAR